MKCEIRRAIRNGSVMRYVHQAVAWRAVRNENSDEMSVEEAGRLPFERVCNV